MFETRDVTTIPGADQPRGPILLTGATGFLGGHFLLKRIAWPGRVHAIVRGDDLAQARARLYAHLEACAQSYGQPLPRADLDDKLHVVLGDITLPLCGLTAGTVDALRAEKIAEVWHCAASLKFEDRHRAEILAHNVGGTGNMLALFERLCGGRPAEFIHVSTAYSVGIAEGEVAEVQHPREHTYNNVYEESKNLAEHRVAEFCTQAGMSHRILRPSVVMGPRASHQSGTTRFGVYGLTREVHRLRETLSKLEHPLELVGQEHATANLTPVDECVYDMLWLSAQGFGEARVFHLCNPAGLSIKRIIETIDSATGVDKLRFTGRASADPSPLQELFNQRTAFYSGYYRSDKVFLRALPPQPQLGWQDVDMYLAAYLRELEQETRGGVGFREQCVRARDGAPLQVCTLGDPSAPPLVLANAYGMPAEFMWNLAQRLAPRFHVVTWECRWVPTMAHAFEPDRCDSLAHARDLVDIVTALALGPVVVAGWSSGAQVALRAMATFPAHFRAGVVMNPGVSIRPSETVRITRFESGIRSLFPKIAGSYRMARKYCELIFGADGGDADDRKSLSNILTSTDPYLLYMTSMPFRNPESLHRYAQMMDALFNERPDAWTGDVEQPVLVYVGGNDVVTHPDVGQALHAGLANGVLHVDPDGDHFSHYYDERLAELVAEFALVHAGERDAVPA